MKTAKKPIKAEGRIFAITPAASCSKTAVKNQLSGNDDDPLALSFAAVGLLKQNELFRSVLRTPQRLNSRSM